MRNLILFIAGLLCSVTALAQRAPGQYSMFDLMQASSSRSEIPFTEEQAFEKSVAVVTGYIDSITEGRVIDIPKANATFSYNTALFKIEVKDVLKGDVGKHVYVEYIRGGMPAEAYDAVKYIGEMKFYLRDIDWYPETTVITNSTKGLMSEVDHLYALFSEELFFRSYLAAPDAPRAPLPTFPMPENMPRDRDGNILVDPPGERGGRIRSDGVVVPLTVEEK